MQSIHTISENAAIQEALERINAISGTPMTLFCLSADGKVTGTVTDGDIRRALIAGVSTADSVARACHRHFRSVECGNIDPVQLKEFRSHGITLVPVLDSAGRLADTIDLTRTANRLPLRALLMAGGKGERLRPATLTVPKPLLRIEDKAIIDYNIESLAHMGITEVYVSTGYLADKVKEHFSRPVAGIRAVCVEEDRPLGTIGAATLLPPSGRHTLVMNSDLITTISFEDMYLAHQSAASHCTMAVIPYTVSVPYAVVETDNSEPPVVRGLEEKPAYTFSANAGIYIFSPQALELLRPGEPCHATDLVGRLTARGMKVTTFTINGTWIDVGSPADFTAATRLLRHVNSLRH